MSLFPPNRSHTSTLNSIRERNMVIMVTYSRDVLLSTLVCVAWIPVSSLRTDPFDIFKRVLIR